LQFWTIIAATPKDEVEADVSAKMIEKRQREIAEAWEKAPKLAEHDHMPIEVASEFLRSPGVRLSGSFRRECMIAREKRYHSIQQRKPVETKLENRLKSATLCQLDKWFRRVLIRRAALNKAALKVLSMADGPTKTRMKNTITIALSAVEIDLTALQDAISDRESRALLHQKEKENRQIHPRYLRA